MVEGATVTSFVTEASTMLVIGLILSMFGIGLFCGLIFTLAVYALPFLIGLTAGMAASTAALASWARCLLAS